MTQRILIVDDEDGLREVLEDLLTLEGYEVTTCRDIDSARKRLVERPYDMALLDVFLTDQPLGLTLGQEILNQYPNTSLAFMTGFADQADIQNAFESGAHACIAKPFALDDVLRVVSAALETRSTAA